MERESSSRHSCPVCGVEAVYVSGRDRFFHLDGTANRPCWLAITHGEAPEPGTAPQRPDNAPHAHPRSPR